MPRKRSRLNPLAHEQDYDQDPKDKIAVKALGAAVDKATFKAFRIVTVDMATTKALCTVTVDEGTDEALGTATMDKDASKVLGIATMDKGLDCCGQGPQPRPSTLSP